MNAEALLTDLKTSIEEAKASGAAFIDRIHTVIPAGQRAAAGHLITDIGLAVSTAVRHGLSPENAAVVITGVKEQFDQAVAAADQFIARVKDFELANIPISGRPS